MEALTQVAAAWAIGITPRHLRDGDAPRRGDGTYSIRELVQWLLERGSDGDSGNDRARKLKAEADLKVMEAEQRAGKLVSLVMVDETLQRLAAALRVLGEDFGRTSVPISGREAQKKVNAMLDSISWGE